MNANAKRYEQLPAETARPVQDEWGLFDPKQAGMAAAFRTMQGDEKLPPAKPAAAPLDAPPPTVRSMPRQTVALPPGEAYELPSLDSDTSIDQRASNGAVYTVEFPVRCPQCHKSVQSFRVFRLLRTQVSFTSTLPRKGYAIVCPECDGFLSADLSGVL